MLAISALSSAAGAPYQPAAGALTPEVVGEKDLAAANSIFSALENLVVVVGPGIGGLLLLTGRPVIGVAINAASFADRGRRDFPAPGPVAGRRGAPTAAPCSS